MFFNPDSISRTTTLHSLIGLNINFFLFFLLFQFLLRRLRVRVGGQSTKRLAHWESSWAYFYCVGCHFFFGKNNNITLRFITNNITRTLFRPQRTDATNKNILHDICTYIIYKYERRYNLEPHLGLGSRKWKVLWRRGWSQLSVAILLQWLPHECIKKDLRTHFLDTFRE